MNYILDPGRLQLLLMSELLDPGSEEAYDRFTNLAALLLECPISLISLVEKDKQYFKSAYGLPEPWASRRQTPLSHSFCQYVVTSQQPLIVADARIEPAFQCNPALANWDLVSYLGFPLTIEGHVLGSVCVIDYHPRYWSSREILLVQEVTRCVTTEVMLRLEVKARQIVTTQLQASEELFRTLANHAPIIIWQTDAQGNITVFNMNWYNFTGFSEQQSLGTGWLQAVHAHDRVRLQALRTQAIKQHLPYQEEFRLRRADSVYREVVARGSPWINPVTKERGYIGTIFDLSERKALERQRETFFSMATHELKSPLTALSGRIQMAQRRLYAVEQALELSPERQMLLDQALNHLSQSHELIEMQNRLINDLMDLARAQTGKLAVQLLPIDLTQVVLETVQEQQAATPQRIITLEMPEGLPIRVLADAQRIHQVLSNYLSNALKFSPAEQPVEVLVSAEQNKAWVKVIDHGIGLSTVQQAHIWEPFYQAQERVADADYHPGLGLGLSICRDLMHEHHGEIGVESVKGEGATFWLTLAMIS